MTTSLYRLQKIARTAQVGQFRNPRALGVMASPPTLTAASSIPSGLTHDYIAAIQASPANLLATDHPFKFSGGYPYINPNVGGVTFPCVQEKATTGGNIDNSGRAARTWRVHFMTDAAKVAVRLLGYLSPYRFLVDGQFVTLDITTTLNAGGAQYIVIDFGARKQLGRKITIEGNSACAFWSAHVDPRDSIWKIDEGDLIKVGLIGDSISVGTGATLLNDAYPIVLGDYLGADDMWSMGIGGTGYKNANQYRKYNDHKTDWTAQDWDLLIFTGGNNDGSYTQSEIQAEVETTISDARTALPNVPFVVFGPTTPPIANNLKVEAAIAAAFANVGDSLMRFVKTQAPAVGSPEMFGTGKTGDPQGDGNGDYYLGGEDGSDAGHPTTDGHLYLGKRRAYQVREAVLDMLREEMS